MGAIASLLSAFFLPLIVPTVIAVAGIKGADAARKHRQEKEKHYHFDEDGNSSYWRRRRRSVLAPPSPSNYTIVRFYMGSHEQDLKKMSGSPPGVVLFDDYGMRIGEHESRLEKVVPGGFKDIIIDSRRGDQILKPSYLHLVAGAEDVCLAAVAIVLPNGQQQAFTGDEVALCDKVANTSLSQTVIGSNPGLRPKKCFWLHNQGRYRTPIMSSISVHLPDFVWTKDQVNAYEKNPELACARSPRLYPYWGAGRTIRDQIRIFSPPLQYDPITKLARDPSRILKWASRGYNPRELSDRVAIPRRSIANDTRTANDTTNLARAVDETMEDSSFTHSSTVEEQRIRTQPQGLVVSDGDISALVQCTHNAPWENYDYYSRSERWFCDMQSRTVVDACPEDRNAPASVCFNETSLMLQSFDGHNNPRPMGLDLVAGLDVGNVSAMHNVWTPTGPLFGYQYADIIYTA